MANSVLLVNFISSLLLKIFTNVQNIATKYKCIYSFIEMNLEASKLSKYICTNSKFIKNAKHIKAWLKLKWLIVQGPVL